MLTLRSTRPRGRPGAKDKPGEKTPDGILELKSLEDLIEGLPQDAHRDPRGHGYRTRARCSRSSLTARALEFDAVDPLKLLLIR